MCILKNKYKFIILLFPMYRTPFASYSSVYIYIPVRFET